MRTPDILRTPTFCEKVEYAVRTPYAKAHPEIIREVLAELQASARWAQANREEAAKLWVQELKLSPAVASRVANYEISEPVVIGERELAALDSLNDWLVSQKLLPKPADIRGHVVDVR